MIRTFGTGDEQVLLNFEQFAPSVSFAAVFSSKLFKGVRLHSRVFTSYQPGVEEMELEKVLVGDRADGVRSIFASNSALIRVTGEKLTVDDFIAAERQVRQIAISSSTIKTVVLNTGPLDGVFNAMRKCTADLIAEWGLDPKVEVISGPQPLTSPAEWVRPRDYPPGALAEGKQSIINFRLMVDETGAPVKCVVPRAYSGEDFAAKTCELLMNRARFTPARDMQGKAVPYYYSSAVRWITYN